MHQAKTSWFLTLTLAETDGNVNKTECQLFFKRMRKFIKFRYYLVSEYGPQTYRPHYHALLFMPDVSFNRLSEIITKSWTNGFHTLSNIHPARIHYCTNYVISRQMFPEGTTKNFCLMSRNPGIGYYYLDKYAQWHTDNGRYYVTSPGGERTLLPRYYADKIFSPADKMHNNYKNQSIREEKEQILREKLSISEPDLEAYLLEQKIQYHNRFVNRTTKNKKV